jgi:hypothetical protein
VGVSVKFINNPNGTPLTTIAEQRSYATLSARSFPAGATHTRNRSVIDEQKETSSLTLDDTALREFRRIWNNTGSSDGTESSAAEGSTTASGSEARSGAFQRPLLETAAGHHQAPWPVSVYQQRQPAGQQVRGVLGVRGSLMNTLRGILSLKASLRHETSRLQDDTPTGRRAPLPAGTRRASWPTTSPTPHGSAASPAGICPSASTASSPIAGLPNPLADNLAAISNAAKSTNINSCATTERNQKTGIHSRAPALEHPKWPLGVVGQASIQASLSSHRPSWAATRWAPAEIKQARLAGPTAYSAARSNRDDLVSRSTDTDASASGICEIPLRKLGPVDVDDEVDSIPAWLSPDRTALSSLPPSSQSRVPSRDPVDTLDLCHEQACRPSNTYQGTQESSILSTPELSPIDRRSGTYIIQSAVLPILLPLAAREGIVSRCTISLRENPHLSRTRVPSRSSRRARSERPRFKQATETPQPIYRALPGHYYSNARERPPKSRNQASVSDRDPQTYRRSRHKKRIHYIDRVDGTGSPTISMVGSRSDGVGNATAQQQAEHASNIKVVYSMTTDATYAQAALSPGRNGEAPTTAVKPVTALPAPAAKHGIHEYEPERRILCCTR